MYILIEYVLLMLVVRLIKILIDVDYCNIFFKAHSKKARWIVCIITYIAATFVDLMFDSIFISIMCTVAGTEDVRIDNYQIIGPSMRSGESIGGLGTVESDL